MPETTNVELVFGDCVRSEPEQQLSACACEILCLEPESCDSDLCIGHVASLRQHSIRASGVACQPAQTARFPTLNVSAAAIAANRRLRILTSVGCWMRPALSNPVGRASLAS